MRCSALAAAAPLQLVPGLQAVLACVYQLHCVVMLLLAAQHQLMLCHAVPRHGVHHCELHATPASTRLCPTLCTPLLSPRPSHTPPVTPPTAVPRQVPLPRIAAPKSTGQQLGATAVAGTVGQPHSLVSWRRAGRRLLGPACD